MNPLKFLVASIFCIISVNSSVNFKINRDLMLMIDQEVK